MFPFEPSRKDSPSGSHPSLTPPPAFSLREYLNLRTALVLLALLLLAIPAYDTYRKFKKSRYAASCLLGADRAEERRDWQLVENWLSRYLEVRPNDVDALLRRAQISEKTAKTPEDRDRVLARYHEVLDLDPSQEIARTRIAELKTNGSLKAAGAGAPVPTADLGNPETERVRAMARDLMKGKSTAGPNIKEAMEAEIGKFERNPSDIETARRLAKFYETHADVLAKLERVTREAILKRADDVMDELVAKRKPEQESAAHLARYEHRRRALRTEPRVAAESRTLDDDLAAAVKADPAHVESRLAAADWFVPMYFYEPLAPGYSPFPLDKARIDLASEQLKKAADADPRDPRPFLGRAQLERYAGEKDRATALLETAIRKIGARDPMLNLRLADLLIETGKWSEARLVIDRLEGIGDTLRQRPKEWINRDRYMAASDVLAACWYTSPENPKRNLSKAVPLIERTIHSDQPFDSGVAAYYAGRCHAALEQYDLAIVDFHRAGELLPQSPLPSSAMAAACRQAGLYDLALVEYDRLLSRVHKEPTLGEPGAVWCEIARTRMNQQIDRPKTRREWKKLDEALVAAKRLATKSFIPLLLEWETAFVRDGESASKRVADEIQERGRVYSVDPAYWTSVSELLLRWDQFDELEKSLKKVETILQRPAHRLRAIAAAKKGDDEEAQAILQEAGGAATDEDQWTVLAVRIEKTFDRGQDEQARLLLESLAKANPNDLNCRFQLGQLAVDRGDGAQATRWEGELQKLEGTAGTFWQFLQMRQSAMQALKGDAAAQARAIAVSHDLTMRRANWSAAHLSSAIVAELQGQWSSAAVAYRSAQQRSRPDPFAIRRLALLSLCRGKAAEAMAELDAAPEALLLSPDLLPLAVDAAIANKKNDRARALAEAALALRPRHAGLQASLAQAILAEPNDRSRASARAALSHAVQLRPSDPALWLSLLSLGTDPAVPDSVNESVATIQGLAAIFDAQTKPTDKSKLLFTVARGYQWAGDFPAAERFYRQSIAMDPGRSAAGWMPRGAGVLFRPEKPTLFEPVRDLSSAPQLVKSLTGLILSSDAATAQAGEKLLEGDPRRIAVALVRRGGADARRRAVELLTSIPAENRGPGDDWLTARLERMDQRLDPALAAYRRVLEQTPSQAILREMTEMLADNGRWTDAEPLLTRWEKENPDSWEAWELRIRQLVAEQKTPDAVSRVREAVPAPYPNDSEQAADDRLAKALFCAELLRRLGQYSEAEKLLKEHVGEASSHTVALSDWLSKHPDGVDAASKLCMSDVFEQDEYAAVLLAARLMGREGVSRALWEDLEKLVQGNLSENPQRRGRLAPLLAAALERRKANDKAVVVLRDALRSDPNNLSLKSQLARVLATNPKTLSEALQLADELIATSGPAPAWLDVKALVLLSADRVDEAIGLLEANVFDPVAPGVSYLHLALAYEKKGMKESAEAFAKIAKVRGVSDLRAKDSEALRRLTP